MSIFSALILAIIEGITEFLPISSTGHLVLTANLLQIPQSEFVKSFEIFIQLGAILSVVFLYWQTLTTKKDVWLRVLAAFLPTAVIGFLLYKIIKAFLLGNTMVTLVALLVGGILLIVFEKMHKEKTEHAGEIEDISLKQAFFIGLVQAVSVIPGVSRAGATVIGALFLGVKRKTAVEFSFLLAIPTMLAATALDLTKTSLSFTTYEVIILFIGFITSFAVALFTVKFFLQFIRNHTFAWFGVYRIVLAVLYWLIVVR